MRITLSFCILAGIHLFCLSGTKSFAQKPVSDTSVINKCFEIGEGKAEDTYNLISVNVMSPIIGDLPFYFEKGIFRRFSIELGAGILLPYYNKELPGFFHEDERLKSPESGYSISIKPKLYWYEFGEESYSRSGFFLLPNFYVSWINYSNPYIGFQFRLRHYNLEVGDMIYRDYSLIIGQYIKFTKRISLDLYFGLGRRYIDFRSSGSKTQNYTDKSLVAPFGLNVGYSL